MTNLAAAVERVKWLVNHNAKMEMIDRSDLETILAELGRLSQECEGTECPLCNGTGKRMVNSFADHTKQIENTCSGCRGKGVIGQNRPPVAGLAELTARIVNDWRRRELDIRMGDRPNLDVQEILLECADELEQAAREFLGKVDA